MSDPSSSPAAELRGPYPHPRRDPHWRRARLAAVTVCALAKGLLFVEAWVLIHAGVRLDSVAIAVLVAAAVVVWTRVPVAMDVFLGVVDRREKLWGAPTWSDIARRAFAGLVAPLSIALIAVRHMDQVPHALAAVVLMGLVEAIYRGAGFTSWPRARLHEGVLRALGKGDLGGAVQELARSPHASARSIEEAVLYITTAAVTRRDEETLLKLRAVLPEVAPAEAPHLALVVEADLHHLQDGVGAAGREAEALRSLPMGHPRRVTYALYVATAALDSAQAAAAISALGRLHPREVPSTTTRVVVNWLLLQAAAAEQNAALDARCRAALATYNIRAEAEVISMEALRGRDDAYARWLVRAREALLSGTLTPAAR